jgi:hypothetical protein
MYWGQKKLHRPDSQFEGGVGGPLKQASAMPTAAQTFLCCLGQKLPLRDPETAIDGFRNIES